MGILLAAAMATVTSLILIGGLIAWRCAPAERRVLTLLVLFELPISPFTFYAIRLPVEGLLESWGVTAESRRLFTQFFRPILEELMKLLPLLFLWKSTTAGTRLWRALAIGLGFGIGEMWMLAAIVYRNDPTTANLGLSTLIGFINERVMVCTIHGALTAMALLRFRTGVPIAIGLHFLGNLPIYFQEIGAFGLAPATWVWLVRAWVVSYCFAVLSLTWLLSGGDSHIAWLLFGDATCPFCGMVYPRATLSRTLRVIPRGDCPRCQARHDAW